MQTKKVVSNIVLIGLVSLFIDMSTEMVYPLIPLFLVGTLGATPAIVGLIEGIAESTSSLLKVFSGYIGDIRQNKKRLTFIGYSASVVYKILLLVSLSWVGVLFARFVDRVGKGIRTAPRDALVAESCEPNKMGHSFGLHKMLDMTGSAIGAALAMVFVIVGLSYQSAFIYAIIPALIGIAIIPAIRESKCAPKTTSKLSLKGLKLDGKLKKYLVVVFIFYLGNSSNAFLLLKARDCGFLDWQVLLLYLIFNISASLLAFPLGKLSDRFGRRRVLVPGYLVFGLVYLGFALLTSQVAIIILFIAYGSFSAITGGAERALIAEVSPPAFKGTVLGLYGMLQGIGLLLASIIAGGLWTIVSPSAPFLLGGILGIGSAIAFAIILRIDKPLVEGE